MMLTKKKAVKGKSPSQKAMGDLHGKNKRLPQEDFRQYFRNGRMAGDSYVNVPARIGDGVPNLVTQGDYPILRLTENYPLILSLYRSSWVVRRIIDKVANDMYRGFPIIDS